MKKLLLLVLAVSFLLIVPGCKVVGLNSCTIRYTGAGQPIVPGGRYLVIYQYTSNPIIIREHVGRSDGTLSVPSHGQPCGSLFATAITNSNLSLTASPASVYLPTPPTTGTVTGQSFQTAYGMPQVDYFDSNGYLAGSSYATSVSSDGTWLQSNMPNLSNVYSGTYQVRVTNKTSEGYYSHIVGAATMTGWGRDRADSDGDGWYDDEDCDPYDPSRNYDCNNYCNNGEGGYYPVHQEICPY
jgi:hypothetical protein